MESEREIYRWVIHTLQMSEFMLQNIIQRLMMCCTMFDKLGFSELFINLCMLDFRRLTSCRLLEYI